VADQFNVLRYHIPENILFRAISLSIRRLITRPSYYPQQ
jgi:hypothetical protein